MFGDGFMETLTIAEAVQPDADDPIIVYCVVATGDTEIGEPITGPGVQVYETAPPPVNVREFPPHTRVEELFAVTVGLGLTLTKIVAEAIQNALLPVTVYVVVLTGDTTIVELVAKVLHVYVVAPLAVKVVVLPEHICELLATA
jgi:hypothetical protein